MEANTNIGTDKLKPSSAGLGMWPCASRISKQLNQIIKFCYENQVCLFFFSIPSSALHYSTQTKSEC